MMARRPLAPVPRLIACSEIAFIASSVNSSSTPSNSKNFMYCLTSAFFGCVRMSTSAGFVEAVDAGEHRQPADELRDQPVLQQVLGQHLARRSRRDPCPGGS